MKLIKILACVVGDFIYIFWCVFSLVVHKVRAQYNCVKAEPRMITSPLIPPPPPLFSFSSLVQLLLYKPQKKKHTKRLSKFKQWELAPN